MGRRRPAAAGIAAPGVLARGVLALGVLALCAALTAGCGSGSGPDPSITLYSGQHPQTTQAVVAGFERATGITVNVRSDDEDVLANQIVAEGAGSPADVIWTENSPALEYLQGKGLLAKVAASTLAATPARYDSPAGDWVGVSARVSTLIYNPGLIAARQLPTSVLALAGPRYRGKLALAPGETDFQPIVTAVARSYGRAAALRWLAGLKANAGSNVYSSNEALIGQVNRGAVAFGVIDQYYWYRLRAEIGAANMHSRLAEFAPRDPGYVVDASGAAVLRSSAHQGAAQKFLAYLVSRAGQQIIASPAKSASFEYPLASRVTTLAREIPFSMLKPYPITIGQLGTGAVAVDLLKQAGLL